MITYDNIQEWAKPHKLGYGKQVRLSNGLIEFSIVGGAQGLYGDFIDNFEVAIIDKKTHQFITKFFVDCPEDIVPYMQSEELLKTLNKFLVNNFQVF